MQVLNNRLKELKIKSKTVVGFIFTEYLYAAAVNTDLDYTDLDTTKVNVTCTLHRAGNKHVIFSDNLRLLHLFTNYNNASWDYIRPGASTSAHIEQRAKDVAVKEIISVPLSIDLGGAINVTGSDELILTVQIIDGAMSADLDSALSYIEVEEVEQVGAYEYYTPKIFFHPVEAGISQLNVHLGDDVTDVLFINLDKTTQLLADAPLTNVSLKSDRLNYQDTYTQLLGKRARMFVTPAVQDTRCQCFVLHTGGEIDKAHLDFNFTSGNINASKNFIGVRSFYQDGRLAMLADAKRSKHLLQSRVKHGVVGIASGANEIQKLDAAIQTLKV